MQLVEEHLEKANSTHAAAHAHIQKVDHEPNERKSVYEVEHGSGLGGFLKWGGKPRYLPYPCPYPTLPYLEKANSTLGAAHAHIQKVHPTSVKM